jgi:hypothetical protein
MYAVAMYTMSQYVSKANSLLNVKAVAFPRIPYPSLIVAFRSRGLPTASILKALQEKTEIQLYQRTTPLQIPGSQTGMIHAEYWRPESFNNRGAKSETTDRDCRLWVSWLINSFDIGEKQVRFYSVQFSLIQ